MSQSTTIEPRGARRRPPPRRLLQLCLPWLATLLLFVGAAAHAGGVGFQELLIQDGDAKPLTVGVWYPTDAPTAPMTLMTFTQTVAAGGPLAGARLPLVVMSHGNGGWYGGHYDTALALARAGFVVAAVTHTGDNYEDQSQALMVWKRSGHIHRLIDYMLAEWPGHAQLDPAKVGMFGFSAGGLTTLVVAGGTPDLTRLAPHCQAHPDYFDCGLIKRSGGIAALSGLAQSLPSSAWVHDGRVKAIVVAAPAIGFAFGPEGLKDVRVPMQLWRDEADHVLPNPDYAEAVRLALPRPPEYHVVANADHYDFLAPCTPALAARVPDICAERPGFDRAAFHRTFDAEVVRFFEQTLG